LRKFLLNEEKKYLSLLKPLNEQYQLREGGKRFNLFLLLFLLPPLLREGLELGEEARSLNY